jgi:ribonuclease T2
MNPRLISALLLAFLIGGAVYLWLRPAERPPAVTTPPAPAEPAVEPKPSTGSKTSDQFLILAASWQPAFCEGASGKP